MLLFLCYEYVALEATGAFLHTKYYKVLFSGCWAPHRAVKNKNYFEKTLSIQDGPLGKIDRICQ